MGISQDTRDEFLLVNGNWHYCLAYAGISVAWREFVCQSHPIDDLRQMLNFNST